MFQLLCAKTQSMASSLCHDIMALEAMILRAHQWPLYLW